MINTLPETVLAIELSRHRDHYECTFSFRIPQGCFVLCHCVPDLEGSDVCVKTQIRDHVFVKLFEQHERVVTIVDSAAVGRMRDLKQIYNFNRLQWDTLREYGPGSRTRDIHIRVKYLDQHNKVQKLCTHRAKERPGAPRLYKQYLGYTKPEIPDTLAEAELSHLFEAETSEEDDMPNLEDLD